MSVIMGPERRRRWRPEDKLAVLAEAFSPGAIVKDVACQRDVATSLIYQWRRQALAAHAPNGFAPVVITEDVASPPSPRAPRDAIVVELGGGRRVRISATAPAELVTAALRALK
ncbi:MAG TPA: transposase [Caulobacteraceae bacterium]